MWSFGMLLAELYWSFNINMGEYPTKFRETISKAMRWSKTGKVWHVGKKKKNAWRSRTESTRGGTVKRMWEIYYLVSMRCWGIRPFQKRRTGKATKMKFITYRHQALTFHLARKPISCPGTPLDDTVTPTVFHVNQSDEADRQLHLHGRLTLAAVKGNHPIENMGIWIVSTSLESREEVGVWRESIAPARRLELAAVKGNHLITQLCSKMDVSGKKKEQRKETELDETCYESNSKYRR